MINTLPEWFSVPVYVMSHVAEFKAVLLSSMVVNPPLFTNPRVDSHEMCNPGLASFA